VFAGSMDAWASAVGAGALRPGQAYDVAGTSEVVGLITAERQQAAGLVSLVWAEGVHQIGGPTQAGADGARWCHDIFRLRGSLAGRRAARRGGGATAARAVRAGAPAGVPHTATTPPVRRSAPWYRRPPPGSSPRARAQGRRHDDSSPPPPPRQCEHASPCPA